jgi:hypothetical protein
MEEPDEDIWELELDPVENKSAQHKETIDLSKDEDWTIIERDH